MSFPANCHATLDQRKALKARVIFLHAYHLHCEQSLFLNPSAQGYLAALYSEALSKTCRRLHVAGDERLDEYLHEFAADLVRDHRAGSPSEVSNVLDEIDTMASSVNCTQACTTRDDQYCGLQGVSDDELTHEFGLCLEPFRGNFKEAVAAAAALYANAGQLAHGSDHIGFGTKHSTSDRPVFPNRHFYVRGHTRFLRHDVVRAVVTLEFQTHLLVRACVLAARYVLFHECIAHAFCSAPCSPNDAFQEGWMDFIALRIHNERVNQGRPEWAAAQAYFDARADTSPGYALGAPAVDCGRKTAAVVLEMFEGVAVSPEEGWNKFCELSVGLNLMSSDEADGRLQELICRGVKAARGEDRTRAAFSSAVQAFSVGGGVQEFLDVALRSQ